MAGLKVFISSTCYDLSILRSNLRSFVSSLGYEPVMSDYADIVYDPRQYTHTSCVHEVSNCDMLIVVIGSRYGGKGAKTGTECVSIGSSSSARNLRFIASFCPCQNKDDHPKGWSFLL